MVANAENYLKGAKQMTESMYKEYLKFINQYNIVFVGRDKTCTTHSEDSVQ